MNTARWAENKLTAMRAINAKENLGVFVLISMVVIRVKLVTLIRTVITSKRTVCQKTNVETAQIFRRKSSGTTANFGNVVTVKFVWIVQFPDKFI